MHAGLETSPIREKAVALTSATYRVVALLPADEPLSQKMREIAVEILSAILDFSGADKKDSVAMSVMVKIWTMQGLLRAANSLNGVNPHTYGGVGVNPLNFAVLEREYGVLANLLEMDADQNKKERPEIRPRAKRDAAAAAPPTPLDRKSGDLSERQRIILTHFNQVKQARISDFLSLLNGISIKTIQRDLQDLAAKNILRKLGEKRWTVYVRNDVL